MWLPGAATMLALPFSVYVYLAQDYVPVLLVANIPVLLGVFA